MTYERVYKGRRIHGRWGGLSATFIAEMLQLHPVTCRRLLYREKKRLDRYPNAIEIARFITENVTKKDLQNLRRFID